MKTKTLSLIIVFLFSTSVYSQSVYDQQDKDVLYKLKKKPSCLSPFVHNQSNSSTISPLIKTYAIGDYAHGGVVFWVDESGQHGLVCATRDLEEGEIRWYGGTNTTCSALGEGMYSGEMNTTLIIASQSNNCNDAFEYAALKCSKLVINEIGYCYGDWYLPSIDELNQMYYRRAIIDSTAKANNGDAFSTKPKVSYWSSTELSAQRAWFQFFDGNYCEGGIYPANKWNARRVRPVRRF